MLDRAADLDDPDAQLGEVVGQPGSVNMNRVSIPSRFAMATTAR